MLLTIAYLVKIPVFNPLLIAEPLYELKIKRNLTLARQSLDTLAVPCISRPMFYKIC